MGLEMNKTNQQSWRSVLDFVSTFSEPHWSDWKAFMGSHCCGRVSMPDLINIFAPDSRCPRSLSPPQKNTGSKSTILRRRASLLAGTRLRATHSISLRILIPICLIPPLRVYPSLTVKARSQYYACTWRSSGVKQKQPKRFPRH